MNTKICFLDLKHVATAIQLYSQLFETKTCLNHILSYHIIAYYSPVFFFLPQNNSIHVFFLSQKLCKFLRTFQQKCIRWHCTLAIHREQHKHRRVTTFSKHTHLSYPQRRFNSISFWLLPYFTALCLFTLQPNNENRKKRVALLISVSLLLFQIVHVEII